MSFFGWFESDSSIFLVMEFFGNGDLAQHIPNISTKDEVWKITTDLFEGLNIIYTKGFAHRDLKPQVCSNNPYQSSFASIIIVEY